MNKNDDDGCMYMINSSIGHCVESKSQQCIHDHTGTILKKISLKVLLPFLSYRNTKRALSATVYIVISSNGIYLQALRII